MFIVIVFSLYFQPSNLDSMFYNPLQQFFVAHAAVCDGQTDMHQLFIRAAEPDPVHFQEGEQMCKSMTGKRQK